MSINSKFSSLLAPVLSLIMVVLLSVPAFAQLATAKVEGTARDKDTGAPLAGVQVIVEGTQLGNVTNADGYYFILNVPPGPRSIAFSYTGYQKTTIANQLLLAGQTSTVDCNLSSTVVELAGITVEGESEVLVPRDQTSTKRRLTADKLTEAPVSTMEDLLVLEAGVQVGGGGGKERELRIRGGRLGEDAVVVDGVTVRNYTANPWRVGTYWVYTQEDAANAEDTTPLEFSTNAVEEVDIITGGFQAEYGNAQSGIVNVVTKEGGTQFKGNVKWTTDQINPETADYGFNALTASVGGPVPLIPNVYFQGSGELQGYEDTYPTHADEGFRGINQEFVDRLNFAVRNDPVLGAEDWWETQGYAEARPAFTLDEMQVGREKWVERMGEDFFAKHYWLQKGLFQPDHEARLPDNWRDRTLVNGKLTASPTKGLKFIGTANFSRMQRTWPSESEAYFRQGYITPQMLPSRTWSALKGDRVTETDTSGYYPVNWGRRTRTIVYLAGLDWNFYRTSTKNATLQFRYHNFRVQDINTSNLKDNFIRDPQFLSFFVHDIPFLVETFPGRDHPDDPEDWLWYMPDGTGVWCRQHDYWTPFGFSQGSQLYYLTYRYLRENQHNFKLDLDFQANRYNRMKFGWQMIFFDNKMFQVRQSARDQDNEFDHRPRLFSAYAQNRTDLGDFVFDYGVRYDSFQPRDNWGFIHGDQYGERFFPENHGEFSPRFNVAFPVTDKAQMRFSYGVFNQLPSFSFIFSGSNPGGLGYQRTDSFEAGLTYLATPDIALDLVGFYRDDDGLVSSGSFFRDYVQDVTGRWVRGMSGAYTNSDRGNVKGFDLTMRKRFSQNYSLNAIYTMMFARSMGSSYLNSTNDELRPSRGDRTHQFSLHFNYLTPEELFAGTLANKVLRDVRAYVTAILESGQPTQEYLAYETSGLNRNRGRWDYNLNLRLRKDFRLGGTKRVSVFTEIFNLTNRKRLNTYPSGYTFQGYRYSPTGGVDVTWEEASAGSGIKRYLFPADFNGDGVLTVMEAAKGSIADSFIRGTQDWQGWGLARQIRSGVEFRF